MNGKLDDWGKLFIKRNSFYKRQICPFEPEGASYSCGDWCPLFSEPIIENRQTKIEICHGKTLYFHKFKDERDYSTRSGK